MATSYTPNFNLAKPLVNGPETENTWGFDINANFDKLDTAVAAQVSHTEVTEIVQDVVGAMLQAGANVAVAYNDTTGKFTISAAPSGIVAGSLGNVFDHKEAAELTASGTGHEVACVAWLRGDRRRRPADDLQACQRYADASHWLGSHRRSVHGRWGRGRDEWWLLGVLLSGRGRSY